MKKKPPIPKLQTNPKTRKSKGGKKNHQMENEINLQKREEEHTEQRNRKKKCKKIWTISRFVRVILAQGPC